MVTQTNWYKRGMYDTRDAAIDNPQADWPMMNRSIKSMCNPWYVPAAKQVAKYVIGLANPFKNNLPLVPWL